MKGILIFLVVFGILVFVHEFGHFIFAKLSNVYVYEFSIGMGKKIFGKKRKNGETEFCLRLVPLGGYVMPSVISQEDYLNDNLLNSIQMEFKSLKNIETGFRQIRFFGIAYLFVCASLVVFSLWKAYSFAEAQRQKIYVLDEGKSLMLALSQDLEQNRPVEAREHVKRFHELFFTLAPDKSAIEGNIQRAMFLSDRSAYEHYSDLAEQGYYNRIISGNVTQRIEVDSISCNFNHYP